MKPLYVCERMCTFAFTFVSIVESVNMTTATHNPEYQRTSSVFEFSERSEVKYDNKLHLDGVGIQVTKALISFDKICTVQHDVETDYTDTNGAPVL